MIVKKLYNWQETLHFWGLQQLKLVVEWLNLHREELYENWDLFWDDETYLDY